MAFPQVASATTQAFAVAATTHSVNLPATVADGDALIVQFTCFEGVAEVTNPAGWTVLREGTFAAVSSRIVAKVGASADSGSSINFGLAVAGSATAIVYRLTGFEGSLAGIESATNANLDCPPLTASWGAADNLWLAFVAAGDDDATVTGIPPGFTDSVSVVSGAGINAGNTSGSARKEDQVATLDPGSFTLSEGESTGTFTVVVRPSAGSTAPTISSTDATAFPGQSRTITGTNFTGATGLDINGTAQADLVVVSDTSATYTAVLGDNSYGAGKTLTLTTPGGTATATIELVAAATGGYVDVVSPAISDTSSFAYNAEDALGNPVATGDQFEWRYTGTITAMTVGADTLATSVDQAGTVEGRFRDATDSTWGAWYMFTLDVLARVIGDTMPRRIGVRSAVRKAVTKAVHSAVYRG